MFIMSSDSYLEIVRIAPTLQFEAFSKKVVRISPIVGFAPFGFAQHPFMFNNYCFSELSIQHQYHRPYNKI